MSNKEGQFVVNNLFQCNTCSWLCKFAFTHFQCSHNALQVWHVATLATVAILAFTGTKSQMTQCRLMRRLHAPLREIRNGALIRPSVCFKEINFVEKTDPPDVWVNTNSSGTHRALVWSTEGYSQMCRFRSQKCVKTARFLLRSPRVFAPAVPATFHARNLNFYS